MWILGLGLENKKTAVDAMSDRRLSRRILFRNKVRYGSWDPIIVGYAFNLSEGGIGIKANGVSLPGSRIAVLLYMGDETIRLEGVVTWVSPTLPGIISTIGIKFLSSTEDIKRIYRQRINQYKTL